MTTFGETFKHDDITGYTFVYQVTCDSADGPIIRTVELYRPKPLKPGAMPPKPGAADIIQMAEELYGPQVELLSVRLIEEIIEHR